MKCKVLIPFVQRVGGHRNVYIEGEIAYLDPKEAGNLAAANIVEILEEPEQVIETAELPKAGAKRRPSSRQKKK